MSLYDEGTGMGAESPGQVEKLRAQAAALRKQGRSVEGDALDDEADKLERAAKQPKAATKHKSKREDSGGALLLAGGVIAGLFGLAMWSRHKGPRKG